jgi:hypothetical protein
VIGRTIRDRTANHSEDFRRRARPSNVHRSSSDKTIGSGF